MGAGTGGTGSTVEQRKRRSDGAGPGVQGGGQRGDVFDQLGNTGVLAQVQAQAPESEEASLLGLAESEVLPEVVAEPEIVAEVAPEVEPEVAPEIEAEREAEIVAEVEPEAEGADTETETDTAALSRGQLEEAAAEEEAARRAAAALEVQESPEAAEALAVQTGVDPVLLTDPKDLGSSDQAKERAMGAEGLAAVSRAVDEAALALGAVKLDDTAKDLVTERIEQNLSIDDIVKARRDGNLDALVQQALRAEAIRSRDEVDFLLQQLAQDQRTMGELLAGGDPDTIAVGMIEHLSVELVEIEDLYALAAYDHGDILKKLVLGDQAVNVHRRLSPLALRMGGFSSVFYQMVVDELGRHPLPVDPLADGQTAAPEQGDPRLPAFRKNLMGLVTELRLFRTASAA